MLHGWRLRGLGAVLAALPAGFLPLQGQGRSVITGTVISDSGLVPVRGAKVTITRPGGSDTILTSDGKGRFSLKRLSPGRYWIVASHLGSESPLLAVELGEREVFVAEFTVRREVPDLSKEPPVLPELETTAVSGRASTFEERMARGLGIYLTEEEIARRESASLNDVLRNVPGVRINCVREGCYPVIQRAPPGCIPSYYLDDMLVDARVIAATRGTEIRGIEIYQGLSQLPPELVRDRQHARCGVIAVWSRRGPEPPPKPPA
jgi:hypothetical protein